MREDIYILAKSIHEMARIIQALNSECAPQFKRELRWAFNSHLREIEDVMSKLVEKHREDSIVGRERAVGYGDSVTATYIGADVSLRNKYGKSDPIT